MKSSVPKPLGAVGVTMLMCYRRLGIKDSSTGRFLHAFLAFMFSFMCLWMNTPQRTSAQLHITAVFDAVIFKDTCQLSNSLWSGSQPELPTRQLINWSQDPTDWCFDHFCAIFRLMTSSPIRLNNVPIVVDSMHIEVGVGFPCLDCALLTSCKACSWETSSRLFIMYQRMTTHWFY